ncbi:MAG: amidophosphoribosyltransferase [Candidatus Bathyarchaeota archaeon]
MARESCGVIGVYSKTGKSVAVKIFYGLMALQHRGQESAGIALTNGDDKVFLKKGYGLVGEALPFTEISMLNGKIGIGHVRYPTTGSTSLTDAQPFNLDGVAASHNGTIVNYVELREELRRKGAYFTSTCDIEVLLNILLREYRERKDYFEALAEMDKVVEGSYSVVCLTGKGEMVIFRDPYGFKPLCYGESDEYFISASESVAIDICGGHLVSDVQPGEALLASDGKIEKKCFAKRMKKAYCMFEYVYFSRPDSVIEGTSVYDVRVKLGLNLAKTYENNADVVVPVPDTSRPAAEGISRYSGLPVAEGLIKNRYIHRTFIMPRQTLREESVKIKLNPLKSVLKGRRIILVDDSIVRGTTIKNIIRMIRNAGAKEVHVRITCPPIISPCFYGIDISTYGELIAFNHSIEEIRRIIGADSLGYQTIDGLVDAIGIGKDKLCLACLTEEYPTPKAQEIADRMKKKCPTSSTRYFEFKNG